MPDPETPKSIDLSESNEPLKTTPNLPDKDEESEPLFDLSKDIENVKGKTMLGETINMLGSMARMPSDELEKILLKEPQADERSFNANDIRGNIERDPTTGKPLPEALKQDAFGNYIDKDGKYINEHGYLVDPRGNVINKDGKIVFLKDKLTDDGDIPLIYRLEGNNFTPLDIIGDLHYDKEGKMDVKRHYDEVRKFYKKYQDERLRDKQGKTINQKGYLVDKEGNIVDKDGKIRITKEALGEDNDGEIPKLLSYEGNRFNIEDVIGTFDRDPKTHEPIFERE